PPDTPAVSRSSLRAFLSYCVPLVLRSSPCAFLPCCRGKGFGLLPGRIRRKPFPRAGRRVGDRGPGGGALVEECAGRVRSGGSAPARGPTGPCRAARPPPGPRTTR